MKHIKRGKKKKIVIFTGYSCNNRCLFCIDADKRDMPEKSTKRLVGEICVAGAKKADIIEIIGGESTIRPDFPALVRAAKKVGIREVVTATNGRVFADMAMAREIIASGIDALVFSIHGPDARTHDALTASRGSFSQLCRGLANLRRLGFSGINGNTTVVKQNMKRLPEIAAKYAALGIRNVEFIFVDPSYGGAYNNFEEIVPRISDAAPYMRKALDIGLVSGFDQWKVRYVPLCYFSGYEKQISETNERRLFLTEHWAPDFRNTDVSRSRGIVGRRKPAVCRGCRRYKSCEGIWVEYLRRRGAGELRPIKAARQQDRI